MKRAFTLIELLVVIAIIALLTSIVVSQFEVARAKARDNKRVADVAQIQLAVQLYFDRCGVYPTALNNTINLASVSTTCPGIRVSTFMSAVPVPPQPAIDATYGYYAYTVKTTLDDYYIGVRLEKSNKALDDDIDIVTPNTSEWSSAGARGWGAANDTTNYYYMVGSK